MKILQVHNYYQHPGGEYVVVQNEYSLLTSHGNEVYQYLKSNNKIQEYSLIKKAKLFFSTTFSHQSYSKLYHIIKRIKPDICHVHNIFPLISPAVYKICSDMNIPVIQTLHNYRLICTNAYLLRNGRICDECNSHNLYHSVKYGCYRKSKIQTWALARSIEKNRNQGIWNKKINKYITLTKFAMQKFIEGGLPADKIVVKPNFIVDPFNKKLTNSQMQKGALFVGRLSEEKGLRVLLQAFKSLPGVKLTIVGDGPLKEWVVQHTRKFSNVLYTGRLPKEEVFKNMIEASFLVFPSQLYETFGMVAIEAFACGLPAIASRQGAMAEIVEDGRTGLLFEPGNAEDLADKVAWALAHPQKMAEMGKEARREYEEKYTPVRNYQMLMQIYESAIAKHKR